MYFISFHQDATLDRYLIVLLKAEGLQRADRTGHDSLPPGRESAGKNHRRPYLAVPELYGAFIQHLKGEKSCAEL